MLCWLSLDTSSNTFACPWLSSSFSSWHLYAHDVQFQIHISRQVKFLSQFPFLYYALPIFLTKKFEAMLGTSFIQSLSISYWMHSIHHLIFPISKTLTFHFLWWSILTHFERSNNIIFIWILILSSFMHSQMPLQLLLIPHYSISFFKLSTIITQRLFGVKSVTPLLIIQRISKF